MKKYRWLLALTALALAGLACKTVMGGGSVPDPAPLDVPTMEAQPTEISPLEPPAVTEPAPSEATPETESEPVESKVFPMPDGAINLMTVGDEVATFQVKMSLEEVMDYYRETFKEKGLEERSLLTAVTDTTFNLVFDGDPSGKAFVVQGVDMGDGTVSVSISLISI